MKLKIIGDGAQKPTTDLVGKHEGLPYLFEPETALPQLDTCRRILGVNPEYVSPESLVWTSSFVLDVDGFSAGSNASCEAPITFEGQDNCLRATLNVGTKGLIPLRANVFDAGGTKLYRVAFSAALEGNVSELEVRDKFGNLGERWTGLTTLYWAEFETTSISPHTHSSIYFEARATGWVKPPLPAKLHLFNIRVYEQL